MNKSLDTNPLVSVIMPAYNAAEFIAAAIDSVIAQDIPLELIIINDCSPDNLDEIIAPYLRNSLIRYIKNEVNLGVAQSRNKGVKLARGKYIAFLDSDDWWETGKLKQQIELIKDTGAVLCCTARELVDHLGTPTGKIVPVKPHITYEQLLKHNCINCSSVVLLKKTAEEFPMKHEDAHEDYYTWLCILKKYGYASAINRPLLKYRLTEGSKSRSKIKSAWMTFKVFRYSGLNIFQSLFYLVSYMFHGILKYY